MADESTQVTFETTPAATDGTREGRRGGQRDGGQRDGGQRDGGGFRIRLSDNEMRGARALQEALGLRSTVAVLGFALRTLAQQLEDGQLEDLIAAQKAQRGSAAPAASRGGERRRERGEGRAGGAPVRAARIDPFARPSRPAAAPEPEPEHDGESEGMSEAVSEALSEAVSETVPDAVPDGSPEPELAAGAEPTDGPGEAPEESQA